MKEFRAIEWISSVANRKSLGSFLVYDRTRQVLYARIEDGGSITDYYLVFSPNLCLQKVIFEYSTLCS